MLTKVFSATQTGLKTIFVEVEITLSRGRPAFIIIGLANKTIDEAKERITSALIHCGVRIKSQKTVVNLAPADVKKSSSSMDLAIAVGLMQSYKLFNFDLSKSLILGELSLDGSLRPVRGILSAVIDAKRNGFERVIFPSGNWDEVSIVKGIKLCPVTSLLQLFVYLKNGELPVSSATNYEPDDKPKDDLWSDFSLVIGQNIVKRALEIAAAGGHNVLMVGPPGSGKSLMAKLMVGILPPLTLKQAISVTRVHSIHHSGLRGLIKRAPFRNPHHSISLSGLVGGGRNLSPGEISLAHHGILFLDEFPEFNKACAEALRQPMEENKITIVRANGSVTYPANFTFIASANPCPCGYKGTSIKTCQCGPADLERYKRRFSGPILDRIDLLVRVKSTPVREIGSANNYQSLGQSLLIRKRVMDTRQVQLQRYQSYNFDLNSGLDYKTIFKLSNISKKAERLINEASENYNFSTRVYFKVIAVARTIADLEKSSKIEERHIAEALTYRVEI